MASVLYLSYDGLLEPIGHSQVFEYLRLLAKDHRITLVTFEKAADWGDAERRGALQEMAAAAGIRWEPLRYHKAPAGFAKLYDIAAGFLLGAALILRHKIDVVHSRSGGPALAMAWPLSRLLGSRLIFDLRGFWADQRADSGMWSRDSFQFRVADWFQRRALKDSDCVVSLTHAGVAVAERFPYMIGAGQRFEVIPTCVNLELFRNRDAAPSVRPFSLGIVGSVGVWYLLDDMLDCFRRLRAARPDARLLIVTRDDHDAIRRRLAAAEVPLECVEFAAVPHEEIPAVMSRLDAGIFLLKRAPSMSGVAPTKLGEFLACGVPCLANTGIGDVERILSEDRVGVTLSDFSPAEKDRAVRRLLELASEAGVRGRCVESARRWFSLEKGAAAYDRIYRELAGKRTEVLFLCTYPVGSVAGQRFSFEQYLQILKKEGIHATVEPFLSAKTMKVLYAPGHYVQKIVGVVAGFARRILLLLRIGRYDFIYLFREAAPLGPPVFEAILFLLGRRVVYYFDDAIFIVQTTKANRLVSFLKFPSKVSYIVSRCHKVAGANNFLVEWALKLNPNTFKIPSTIDPTYHKPLERTSDPARRTVIGWTGSLTTAKYLDILRPILKKLQEEHDFEFRVICDVDPGFPELANYRFVKWTLQSEIEDLGSIDIGVMPVPEGNWEMGKVGFKAVQYGALGIAAVVSETGSGGEVVLDGRTGRVVKNTLDDWHSALSALLKDPEGARRFGRQAREHILDNYSVPSQIPGYLRLFCNGAK